MTVGYCPVAQDAEECDRYLNGTVGVAGPALLLIVSFRTTSDGDGEDSTDSSGRVVTRVT